MLREFFQQFDIPRVPAIMAYMRTRRPGNFSATPSVTRGRAVDRGQNEQENGLIEILEDLALFEELKKDLLPELREMVKKGEKSSVILEKGRALASARLVTLAATGENPAAALAAIKEVLDRTDGKVADKKQIEHRLAKIDDKELDALLMSKITEEAEGND